MKNWTLKVWLVLVSGVLTAIEPHVIELVAPGWQPKIVSACAAVIAALAVVIGVLNVTTPQDQALVGAAAAGTIGKGAFDLASPASKKASLSKPPPPIGPAAGMVLFALAWFAWLSGHMTAGCTPQQAKAVQTAVDVAVVVAGDVCKVIAQDDPTAPQWVQVSCSVVGQAGPVLVMVPWSSWLAAKALPSAGAAKLQAVAKP